MKDKSINVVFLRQTFLGEYLSHLPLGIEGSLTHENIIKYEVYLFNADFFLLNLISYFLFPKGEGSVIYMSNTIKWYPLLTAY